MGLWDDLDMRLDGSTRTSSRLLKPRGRLRERRSSRARRKLARRRRPFSKTPRLPRGSLPSRRSFHLMATRLWWCCIVCQGHLNPALVLTCAASHLHVCTRNGRLQLLNKLIKHENLHLLSVFR